MGQEREAEAMKSRGNFFPQIHFKPRIPECPPYASKILLAIGNYWVKGGQGQR
jgi:hypothetical protein